MLIGVTVREGDHYLRFTTFDFHRSSKRSGSIGVLEDEYLDGECAKFGILIWYDKWEFWVLPHCLENVQALFVV